MSKISYESYLRQELQKQAYKDNVIKWKIWENNKVWEAMQEKKNCKCNKKYINYE